MNKEVEIAVTLNTDEANEKLEQLTAKAQALADLFTSIAEQADHAAKIMPPSAVEAVYAMCHGCPPTTNFMRSISEMLRISLPEFENWNTQFRTAVAARLAVAVGWCCTSRTAIRPFTFRFLDTAALKFFRRLSKVQTPCGTPRTTRLVKCVVNNNSMRVWRYRRRTDRCQQSNAPCRKGCERLNGHCAGR